MNQDQKSAHHPNYYNKYPVETWDIMEFIYGTKALILYCKINALKYRLRAGLKPGNSIEKDFEKEKVYLDKAEEFKKKLQKG